MPLARSHDAIRRPARQAVLAAQRFFSTLHEPRVLPPGFGLRLSSGAFQRGEAFDPLGS